MAGGPGVCLETAEGRAGEIVELEVHLLKDDGESCRFANEAWGLIEIDPSKFELANDADQLDCTTRHQIPDVPGTDLITWQRFGDGAIQGCQAPAGIGKVDVIKVKIKDGVAPGDYDLGWQGSELFGAGPAACLGTNNHIGGSIRVLP